MAIRETLASAFDTCLDYAHNVARRIGRQIEPLIGSRPQPRPPPAIPETVPPGNLHACVEEARFQVGLRTGPRSPARLEGDPGTLASTYGYDCIVLLARDPWSAFAYWEIITTSRARTVHQFGAHSDGGRDVLRVYEVGVGTLAGQDAGLWFDVDLPAGVESWYLKLPRAGGSYYVEIGLCAPGGQFLALARSNTITTPRTSPSRDDTLAWVTLGDPGPAGR